MYLAKSRRFAHYTLLLLLFIYESLYTVTMSVHVGVFFTGPCVIYKEEYKNMLKLSKIKYITNDLKKKYLQQITV